MTEWLPIKQLFDFEKGILQSSKCIPGKYDFVTAADGWKTHNEFTHNCEALIFAAAASGSLGRIHYINGKFISSDLCFILTPKKDKEIDMRFYYRVFHFIKEDIVRKTATGTSKLAINKGNFGDYKLPYFDIIHQRLFSEKMDSIAAIKDELVTGFENQAEYLSQLRQAILQEAIEGKLTADWRKNNPVRKGDPDYDAAALLEKIKEQKVKLIKEGKIKKQKPFIPIVANEMPFEFPKGWVQCRVGELIKELSTGPFGTMLHKSDYVKQGIPIVNPMNIIGDKIIADERMLISEKTKSRLNNYSLSEGDLVIARRGNLSKCAVVDKQKHGWICGTGSFFLRTQFTNNTFFRLVYTCERSQKYLLQDSIGQTMDNLNQGLLMKLPIGLPPLQEQNFIVEQVDRLMAMVDELEVQVTARKTQSAQLMQSVLREAFNA